MYEGKTDHTWDWIGMLQYSLAAFSFGGTEQQPVEFHPLWLMNQEKKRRRDPNINKLDPTESVKSLAAAFMRKPAD